MESVLTVQAVKRLEKEIENVNPVKGGSLFFSALLRTEPKMNKTAKKELPDGTIEKIVNPYLGRVVKVQSIVANLGAEYEKAVNNRRAKEGEEKDFVSGVLTGRHHVDGFKNLLQSDKNADQYYLQFIAYRSDVVKKSVYLDTITGKEIAYDDLKPFFPKKTPNVSQGVENPIITFSPKLQSVVALKCGTIDINSTAINDFKGKTESEED